MDEATSLSDASVFHILSDLQQAARAADYFAPMASAARRLRIAALTPSRKTLTPLQKERLTGALREALNRIDAALTEPREKSQLLTSINALGTLVLSWAGDDRWPPEGERIFEARDFARALELEMERFAVLSGMLDRWRANGWLPDTAPASEETAS